MIQHCFLPRFVSAGYGFGLGLLLLLAPDLLGDGLTELLDLLVALLREGSVGLEVQHSSSHTRSQTDDADDRNRTDELQHLSFLLLPLRTSPAQRRVVWLWAWDQQGTDTRNHSTQAALNLTAGYGNTRLSIAGQARFPLRLLLRVA